MKLKENKKPVKIIDFIFAQIATIFDKDQPEIEYDLRPLNMPTSDKSKGSEYNYEANSHLISRRNFNSKKKREAEDGKENF